MKKIAIPAIAVVATMVVALLVCGVQCQTSPQPKLQSVSLPNTLSFCLRSGVAVDVSPDNTDIFTISLNGGSESIAVQKKTKAANQSLAAYAKAQYGGTDLCRPPSRLSLPNLYGSGQSKTPTGLRLEMLGGVDIEEPSQHELTILFESKDGTVVWELYTNRMGKCGRNWCGTKEFHAILATIHLLNGGGH